MNKKVAGQSGVSGAAPRFVPILAALRQKSSEVTVREPGQRFLGAPEPLAAEAEQDWEFAWLSAAAYAKIRGADDPTPSSTAITESRISEAAAREGVDC